MRLHPSPKTGFALTLLFTSFSVSFAQVIADLPQCWQNCINNRDFTCSDTDIPCICQASRGTFLTDVVACVNSACSSDTDLGPDLVLSLLEAMCQFAGIPIPPDVIQSAEDAENTGAASSGWGFGYGAGSITTRDGDLVGVVPLTAGERTTTTLVGQVTDGYGQTYTVLVPEIYDSSTTFYGAIETVTSPVATATRTGRPTPVPLGGNPATDPSSSSSSSFSSTPQTSATAPTDSAPPTPSTITTAPSNTLPSTSPAPPTSTSTTPAAASSENNGNGNGSPFEMQGAATKKEARSLLGLTVGLIAGITWF
ncbi:hypothetical protein MMC24_003319 [Lignoscripta atroalba]|nr:hypothetical protein [Lignoscripta atroalba]